MFNSNKKMENQISEIRNWATQGIPALIASKPGLDVKGYFQEGRLCLNLLLIETLIGAEITADTGKNAKGDYKIKFNRRLPTATELAEISEIVAKFIKDVEKPFLDQFTTTDPGDMNIPDDVSTIRLEKINAKSMKELIFGGAGPVTNRMLNAIDCIQLAGVGEQLRKRTIRNRVLIVGGIALVVTGGTIVGVNMYKKHKDKVAADTGTDGAPEVDLDSGDLPEVNMDDSGDAPVVTID